jgi:hypothetical protein
MSYDPFGQFDDSQYRGRPYQDVVAELKVSNSNVHAVPNDAMGTMDHKLSRLRVRYDASTGLVTGVRRG